MISLFDDSLTSTKTAYFQLLGHRQKSNMGYTALLILFLSIYLSYASVSATYQERASRNWTSPSSKKCMEFSEKCSRVQLYCVPYYKHEKCSKWQDSCNQYNHFCPKIVTHHVVAVPQQVVPQQIVVHRAKPQKIKIKLFG